MHTHSSELTHTVNTHPEQWAAIYATAPQEQLGDRCLAQGHLVVVLKVERALYIHSPQQYLLDCDSNSQPFDYESNSLQLGHNFPAAEVEGLGGQLVSAQTIQRTLHQIGLHGCHPRRKPLLNSKQLAEDKQTKDMDYWNHVLWSDETKINVFGSDGVKHM